MIRILEEQTINQIAAGEVIENPASVVKELVENALDAGATEIRVKVIAGGRQLIQVVDNGCGMRADEAPLAFERHATSKIVSAEDLGQVATMGFRGEALAAIASVSKVVLTTANGELATRVVLEGGKVVEQGVAARPRGSTVEVRSPFYNAPVRRRFQKSIAQDNREIGRIMTLLALAYPDVGFSLWSDDKAVFELASGEVLQERVRALICRDGWCEVKGEVWGVIGEPRLSRPSRVGQYCFVNRRPVVSALVGKAVTEAFGTRVPVGRFPLFVLHLDLAKECVDVNVHPQKREVRFSDEGLVREMVHEGVAQALTPPMPQPISPPITSRPSSLRVAEAKVAYEPAPVRQAQLEVRPSIRVTAVAGGYALVEECALPPLWQRELGGWVVVDLRAVQRRLVYDALMKERPTSQALLVPMTVELVPQEFELLETHREELEAAGFGVRPFGDHTVLLEGVPSGVLVRDGEQLVKEAIAALGGREKGVRHRIALAAARHAGQRVGQSNAEVAQRLLDELLKRQCVLESPQGRPLWVRLGLEELARRFRNAAPN